MSSWRYMQGRPFRAGALSARPEMLCTLFLWQDKRVQMPMLGYMQPDLPEL